MTKYMDKLNDKEIVIVGGSSGIGFGTAELLLDAGAKVTIISSSSANIESAITRLKSSIGPDAKLKGFVGDVRNEVEFVALLRKLAHVVGGLDHVIFSGVDKIIRGKLEDMELEDAKWLFGVKFWGAVTVGKAVLKYDIIKRGGSLTLTSGMAANKPGKGAAVGGALNGGVLSLTKGLACDLADKRIRVNCVVPGLVQTELWNKLGRSAEDQKKMTELASEKLPVGFVATGLDIAEAYLYAVRADYATGSLIEIDGGSIL